MLLPPGPPGPTRLSASYSPGAPSEEWSPEEEERVMEEVLGRVPASSSSGLFLFFFLIFFSECLFLFLF